MPPIIKGRLHSRIGVFGDVGSSTSLNWTVRAPDAAIVLVHTVSINAPDLIIASASFILSRCLHPREAAPPRHISTYLFDSKVAVQAFAYFLSDADFWPDILSRYSLLL